MLCVENFILWCNKLWVWFWKGKCLTTSLVLPFSCFLIRNVGHVDIRVCVCVFTSSRVGCLIRFCGWERERGLSLNSPELIVLFLCKRGAALDSSSCLYSCSAFWRILNLIHRNFWCQRFLSAGMCEETLFREECVWDEHLRLYSYYTLTSWFYSQSLSWSVAYLLLMTFCFNNHFWIFILVYTHLHIYRNPPSLSLLMFMHTTHHTHPSLKQCKKTSATLYTSTKHSSLRHHGSKNTVSVRIILFSVLFLLLLLIIIQLLHHLPLIALPAPPAVRMFLTPTAWRKETQVQVITGHS